MSKKLTFAEVKEIVYTNSNGKCELLDYEESHVNMNIRCKCGKIFSVLLGNLKNGKSFCNDCLIDLRRQKEFDKILNFIFSNGNIVLSKSKEFEDSKSKLKILCKCGKVFETTYRGYKHKNKRQCNDCGYSDIRYNRRNMKYVYELFNSKGLIPMFSDSDYKNTNSSLAFKCKKHIDEEIQYTTFNSLVRDFAIGCTHCRNRKLRDEFKEKNPREYFIEKGFIPLFENEEYINSNQSLPFICKIHESQGIQTASLTNVKYKKGCSYCNISIPKGEVKIQEILSNYKMFQYKIQQGLPDCKYKNPLKFDFLIFHNGNLKLIVEYDGQQHFEPVDFGGKGETWAIERFIDTKKRDQIKNEYCKNNNIPLLRIPYWEFDNIEEILNNKLKQVI